MILNFVIATVTKPTTKPATIKPTTIKPTTTTEFSKLKEDVANLMKDGMKICFSNIVTLLFTSSYHDIDDHIIIVPIF